MIQDEECDKEFCEQHELQMRMRRRSGQQQCKKKEGLRKRTFFNTISFAKSKWNIRF